MDIAFKNEAVAGKGNRNLREDRSRVGRLAQTSTAEGRQISWEICRPMGRPQFPLYHSINGASSGTCRFDGRRGGRCPPRLGSGVAPRGGWSASGCAAGLEVGSATRV